MGLVTINLVLGHGLLLVAVITQNAVPAVLGLNCIMCAQFMTLESARKEERKEE